MRISDWSSDVCSSDLDRFGGHEAAGQDQGEENPPLVLCMMVVCVTCAHISLPTERTAPRWSPRRHRGIAGGSRCHSFSIQAIRRVLVAPGVPKGTPAVITILSPTPAYPSRCAMALAFWTMLEKLVTSPVWTLYTPQTSDRRRAVRMSAVSPRIGTSGRSRAARRAVAPDMV